MDLHYKQEITVGALVLVGVALFVWGTMWLGGRSFSSAPNVAIAFTDAGTLKRGSPVKVSGVLLGSVQSIEYQEYGKVLVRISLDPRVKPRRDASAQLSSVGLVADAVINFNPGADPEPLPADAIITGTIDKGFMALGDELSKKAKELMTNLSEIANKNLANDISRTLAAVQRMADLYANPRTGPSAELSRTLVQVQQMGARLDSTLSEFKLGGTLVHADTLMDHLSRLSADARAAALRLDTLVARINRGQGSLGRFVTDTA
ncbi:MAG TPA: MlaD family protein, partial [Gemmatimonadales bacterium]|nr:MlaD family protein [Gemmatimonadales bacterium]